MATLVAAIRERRKFHPSCPMASVGQASMALCSVDFLGCFGLLKNEQQFRRDCTL
jgi:hypothetical protein